MRARRGRGIHADMSADALHDRLLAIVKKLPGAEEDYPWGSIHCKVAGKIFVGWSRGEDGAMSVGLRTTPELQSALVRSDPRFSIAKYSGKYGGIDMRLGPKPDFAEVEQFIVESYRIVAPKRLVRELDEQLASGESSAKRASAPGKKREAKPSARPAATDAKKVAKRAPAKLATKPAKSAVKNAASKPAKSAVKNAGSKPAKSAAPARARRRSKAR